MNARRIAAISLIFVLACAGWWILGASTAIRSTGLHGRLGAHVEKLWGIPLAQQAPSLTVEIPGSKRVRSIMPTKNDIRVALNTEYRKKGLIWFPTYTCDFDGAYTISNAEQVAQKVRIHFSFPAQDGTYDEFAAWIDDRKLLFAVDTAEGLGEIIELAPGQSKDFRVTYKTRGVREWRYKMDPSVARVQNFSLVVQTGFRDVDYPEGCLSPMSVEEAEDGLILRWQATDLITKEDIGVTIPEKLNPGPLVSRITFFAPVCLVFFFVLIGAINILYKASIHPMHYLFVAAGFFGFHLLLAYMAGIVNIHVAFVTSAAVSVVLVTSYLSAALRGEFPWKVAAAGQLFFLVLFSYSFFLKGKTGITVAIGSVVTLAVLMKVTAHVDWQDVFSRRILKPAPPPPPLGTANAVAVESPENA
ncbi:MAG TPA: hypothetical protein HPP77_01580 [Candidatus Hydrogenedentes bacterium]|nr:hypothetical protein [Candidatus Hydrogenedentota bacterium]